MAPSRDEVGGEAESDFSDSGTDDDEEEEGQEQEKAEPAADSSSDDEEAERCPICLLR
jgi:hypothetical protein